MTPTHPSPAEESTQEISGLISLLHESGRRLEELTAGEVDAVVDRDGRAFMLQRAQEKLRNLDAAKQAAILNALPANVALLDARGRIISANDSWLTLASAQGMQGLVGAVGLDYLELCDSAPGHNSLAHQVAAGVRSVLAGQKDRFWIEYPWHSMVQQRWFQLTATPLADGAHSGVIVMQLDVTVERQIKDRLKESERRFSDMLGNVELIAIMIDSTARLTYCNDHFLALTGWSREDVIGCSYVDQFIPAELVEDLRGFTRSLLANTSAARHHENEIVTRTGERRLIRWSNTILRSSTGATIGAASIGEDITARKRAEISIRRLNRVHAVLSQANALAARVRSREELFKETCRIAVEVGDFSMAWIGVVDPRTLDGQIVARYGGDDIDVTAEELTAREGAEEGNRPENLALRQLLPVICNDIATDSSAVSVREELLENGHRSAGYFPLTLAGHTRAVIALFACEPGAFDEQETKLLLELAGDISFALNHIEKQERLDYLAYYDTLTGLANRSLFLERLAQFQRSAVSASHKLAVLLVDLERFKNINDGLGRLAGDTLLRLVAEWMKLHLGGASVLGRVGADQFAVIVPKVKDEGEVTQILDSTVEALLQHPFRLNDAVFRVSAKIGVALFPDDSSDADVLLRNAEAALKRARLRGDRYRFYTEGMTEMVAGKLTLENQLHRALKDGEFVLHYQPKKSFFSGELTGVEALIRWNDPRTGLVPPGRFIPILEETGLIYDVGRWALRQAIDDYLRWQRMGVTVLRIAVNVSPLQVRHRDFVGEIRDAIAVDARAAAGLELELTESLIMEDVRNSIASLRAIRALGVQIAIDDFGTGFSSLSYLSRLPVDILKIDRSFVVDMTVSPEGLALVSTIINLAHSMKLTVVAEGVETKEQARLLRLLNCDEMQGFLLGPPVPSAVLEAKYLVRPPADGAAAAV